MGNKNIFAAGSVLLLIVVGMFIFAYIKKQELQEPVPTTTQVEEDPSSPYGYITRIDAKYFYIDGKHTVVGEMLMPTSCDLLNWNTRILESYPGQVIIDFEVINHAEMCAQVMTPQRFSVTFEASEAANIRATLQGREIEVNLIPANEGEKPEDFELYIKG